MTGRACLATGAAVLALAWLGPLPRLAGESFTAHMSMHMLVVAVAAPLIALGWPRLQGRWRGAVATPLLASLVDFVVIWVWHAPALHQMARSSGWALAFEQISFLAVGVWVWGSALGGGARRVEALAGAAALFFTAMHMTLLGALIGLATRPLHGHGVGLFGLSPLDDQHLGGVIMLAVGGLAYLVGALVLVARVLHPDGRITAGDP